MIDISGSSCKARTKDCETLNPPQPHVLLNGAAAGCSLSVVVATMCHCFPTERWKVRWSLLQPVNRSGNTLETEAWQ